MSTAIVKSSSKSKATAVAVVVTEETPRSPEWDVVRQVADECIFHGRMFLRGQVKLGMLLAALKKAHGVQRGGDQKSNGRICRLIPWDELVTQQTGYSARTCREFIRLADVVREKLKKSKKLKLPGIAKKDALALFQPDTALALTTEEWVQVDAIISSLTAGETQSSLMQEMGLVPKVTTPAKTGSGEDTAELTAGELACEFFKGVAAPILNARTNPEYRKLLAALPPTSDDDHPVSLAALEAECRAFIADIEEVKTETLKPAKGRVTATK